MFAKKLCDNMQIILNQFLEKKLVKKFINKFKNERKNEQFILDEFILGCLTIFKENYCYTKFFF